MTTTVKQSKDLDHAMCKAGYVISVNTLPQSCWTTMAMFLSWSLSFREGHSSVKTCRSVLSMLTLHKCTSQEHTHAHTHTVRCANMNKWHAQNVLNASQALRYFALLLAVLLQWPLTYTNAISPALALMWARSHPLHICNPLSPPLAAAPMRPAHFRADTGPPSASWTKNRPTTSKSKLFGPESVAQGPYWRVAVTSWNCPIGTSSKRKTCLAENICGRYKVKRRRKNYERGKAT